MSTEDNLELLASLDRKGANLRRRAGLVAWVSVAAAAIVMAGLIFVAYRHLAQVREAVKTESEHVTKLQEQKKGLDAEIANLKPLVENYRAFARQAPVAEAKQTPDTMSARTIQPRVYLQIVDPVDRDYAKGMGTVLEQAGFKVMGIEYVKQAAGLRNTEVRYYKKADEAEAEKIVSALRKAGDPSVTILNLGLDNNTKVRPRHYEVWFRAQTQRN